MDDKVNNSPEHMLPKHSDAAILAVTLAVLLGGPGLGIVLARLFAPGSGIALLIGFLLLPCAHLAGRFGWAVMGFVVDPKSEGRRAIRAVSNLGRWIDEPRRPHEKLEHDACEGRFPRGGSMFVLVHALFALAAGLIVGLVLTDIPVTTVVCAYTFTGTLYGATVYFMALKGYVLMRSERAD
ncbi:MAG: hypothetical protein H8E44_03275 [Planctomycetes bacterium]|nr:hypothetical protein [Planctomycetota bacterium]